MASRKGHAESPTAQQRIEHVNAVLRAIRSVNQLIVHEKDLNALVRQACNLLVETRGYHAAWIALLDAEGNLRTVVQAGLGAARQSMAEWLQRGEFTACGRRALAEPGVHVIDAPSKECVDCPLSHSYEGASGMTVRLEYGGRTYGLMSASVPAEYARDDEEEELFQEVAGDIAYAVHNLAVEDAHNRAVEALRESEEEFRSLFEQSMDAISVTAFDGSHVEANQAWLDLFGYSRDELPGLAAVDIYANPKDREDFLRRIAGTRYVEDEVRFKKKDGTVFDCQRTVVARKDEHGNTVAYRGIHRDITEHKKAQEELRSSEERYRAVFEQSRDAIAVVAPDGRISEANQAWLDLFGYSRDEVSDLNAVDTYVEPEDRKDVLRRMEDAGFFDGEVRLKKKDGTIMDCHGSVVARKEDHGDTVVLQVLVRDITEQKRAQQVLKDSEEKYRELFEQSMDAISLVGPGGLILEANQAYADLFGYSKEEIGRRNVESQYVDPEGRTRFLEWMSSHDALVDDDVQLKKNDGTIMDCLHTAIPRLDEDGGIVGYQSVIRDITEQKRAQQALKGSEEKFRELFEQSRDAILLVEPSGRMLNVNQAWLDLFGYASDEVPDLNVVDTYANPKDREDFLRRIARTGYIRDEVRSRKKDGTVIHCERTTVVLRDVDGHAVVYQSLIRDITEQRRARQALEESEKEFRSLFEQSREAIALVRPTGLFLDVNQAWLDLHGYSRDELTHFTAVDLYANPKDREDVLRGMEDAGFFDGELRFKKKNGIVMDCRVSIVARKDEHGNTGAFQTLIWDITEQKRAQEQLEESHAQLQRMLQGTLEVVEEMTEARDPYTAGHQRRVAELSTAIARQMKLPEESCVSIIRMAALIHDIGKVSVPVQILVKPGRLTDTEYSLIKVHSQVGYDILKRAGLPYPVAEVVLQHHERLDGSGYPQGLSGDDTLPEAQILAVADVVEAMSSHRPYRPALGIEAALEEVSNGSGTRYYPDVVEACLAVFRQEGFTFSSSS